MKHFLLKIFYISLPFMVLSYPIDYIISSNLIKSNQYAGEYEVMNDIYNSDANCDVAIYGASRAWLHIDPKIISDTLNLTAYNFGIDGHNFWLEYLRHLELLKHNKKPKNIIISIDVFFLQKRVDLYNLEQFLPYMLWNENIKEFTSSYIGFDVIDYYVPLIRYAGKYEALKTSKTMLFNGGSSYKFRHNGYFGSDRKWNSDFAKAKAERKSYEIELDNRSVDLFEQFIKECEKMNINLVLVYTPEYIEGQHFVSNRGEVVSIINEFANKYDLSFYNYSDDEMCLDKKFFFNANHLNKIGAEIFSKKFAHDLKTSTHSIVY